MWKEAVEVYFSVAVLSQCLLRGNEKNHKNISHDS
jgi:hypothetical protein